MGGSCRGHRDGQSGHQHSGIRAMSGQSGGARQMPPGGKLAAMRAFGGTMAEFNEARDGDRVLGAKIALDAALKLSQRLGVYPSALIDLLAALEDRDHGRLPDWIKPT